VSLTLDDVSVLNPATLALTLCYKYCQFKYVC